MERTLYLFATHHTREEILEISPKEDHIGREHWKWIENQINKLPHANRAYFNSLDEAGYSRRLTYIQAKQAAEEKAKDTVK